MNSLYNWKDATVSYVFEISAVTALISLSKSLSASSFRAFFLIKSCSIRSFSFLLALLSYTNSITFFLSDSNSRTLSPSAFCLRVSLSARDRVTDDKVRFLSSVLNISFFCAINSVRGTESDLDLAERRFLYLVTCIAADIKLLFRAL